MDKPNQNINLIVQKHLVTQAILHPEHDAVFR